MAEVGEEGVSPGPLGNQHSLCLPCILSVLALETLGAESIAHFVHGKLRHRERKGLTQGPRESHGRTRPVPRCLGMLIPKPVLSVKAQKKQSWLGLLAKPLQEVT